MKPACIIKNQSINYHLQMKFTVAIPAFKARFLKECIDSVLSQTCEDFELIIVNDNSPEEVGEIVSAYSDDRIKYSKNDINIGAVNVVDNWNKCLSLAQGSYFVLLGDDDKMCSNYLEVFSKLIDAYIECDVFHCRTIIIDEFSKPIAITEPRPEFETVYDAILERMKGTRLFFISDYVFKTSTLKNNGGFYKIPLAWASDDISSYIAAERNGMAHTNEPVFMYRRNSLNISTNGDPSIKMEAILQEEKWLNNFLQKQANSFINNLLKDAIKQEVKKFIQKKKIRTLYSSSNNLRSWIKWLSLKKKYELSTEEVVYAFLMSIKENRKEKYFKSAT
jgi:glycosyltransferase involved in cell wall biosynthesis